MADRWSYKVDRLRMPMLSMGDKRAEVIEEAMNRRGLEGWEFTHAVHPERGFYVYLYFRKPI